MGLRPDPVLGGRIGAYAVPSFPKDIMTIRLIGALLCGATFVLVTTTGAVAAEDKTKKKTEATTIITSGNHGLSGKSNTTNRMGGGGGAKGQAGIGGTMPGGGRLGVGNAEIRAMSTGGSRP